MHRRLPHGDRRGLGARHARAPSSASTGGCAAPSARRPRSPPGGSSVTPASTTWPSARRWPPAATCRATSSAPPRRGDEDSRGSGCRQARGRAGPRRPSRTAAPGSAVQGPVLTLPFYAGCALPQDGELHALVHEVAAGFGVRLDEAADAGCCGHPSRGAVPSLFTSDAPVCDGVPRLRRQPRGSVGRGRAAVGRADRAGAPRGLRPARPLLRLRPLRRLPRRPRPALARTRRRRRAGRHRHARRATRACTTPAAGRSAACTAAPPRAARRLLEFAAERRAPIVTPCVLCRDNVRSAARQLRLDVPVYFWPEFFRAAERLPEEAPHA